LELHAVAAGGDPGYDLFDDPFDDGDSDQAKAELAVCVREPSRTQAMRLRSARPRARPAGPQMRTWASAAARQASSEPRRAEPAAESAGGARVRLTGARGVIFRSGSTRSSVYQPRASRPTPPSTCPPKTCQTVSSPAARTRGFPGPARDC
jgi:hypothetical protein